MDDADHAQDMSEIFLQNALKRMDFSALPFSGKCMQCNEILDQRRFCDQQCREDYEGALRRRRLGRPIPL